MTIAERNNKLRHFITCLKCEVSGKCCDDNCSTQYEAGTMGEIIENLEAISKALEQEPTTKNDSPKYCDLNICLKNEYNNIGCCEVTKSQEPTAKNDLGVDCVARKDVERYIEGFINEYTPREELEFINLELDGLKHIPSVTPQLSSGLEKNSKKLEKDFGELDYISRAQTQTEIEMNASRYTIAKERGGMGQVEWSDQLIKVSDAVDIIRHLPSVTPQEPILDKIFCIIHPLSIMSTPELEHKAIMQITEMLEPLCLPESEEI